MFFEKTKVRYNNPLPLSKILVCTPCIMYGFEYTTECPIMFVLCIFQNAFKISRKRKKIILHVKTYAKQFFQQDSNNTTKIFFEDIYGSKTNSLFALSSNEKVILPKKFTKKLK